MPDSLPEKYSEGDIGDIQSINVDLLSLVATFINPIEAMRSKAAPQSFFMRPQIRITDPYTDVSKAVSTLLQTVSFNQDEAQESLAHTFYRMLGLPVMSEDGSFYNPGFNPSKTNKARTANMVIAGKVALSVTKAQTNREISAKVRRAIFQKNLTQSSVYAAVLDIAKQFQVIDEAAGFMDLDPQTFTISTRKDYLISNYELASGSPLTFFADTGQHMLRPFLVEPTIADTVMPQSRLICEPFLKDKNATKLDSNTFLRRPGIEFILRMRLSQTPTASANEIADQVIFTLDSQQDVAGLTAAESRQLAIALLDDNKVNGEQVSQLFNTPFEVLQINKLVKTIKALIYKLVSAGELLDEVRNNLEWTPLPGDKGFGDPDKLVLGGVIRTKARTSVIEKRIDDLNVKVLNSSRQAELKFNLNDFAFSSYEQPSQKTFDHELATAVEERNNFVHTGAQALAAVEHITGEISGLGLIDILAVYTALWAIDLDVLISLLDDQAFDRLYENNADLRNANVEQRSGFGGPVFTGTEAMQRLEAQIISILAFADKEFGRYQQVSSISDGGKP